MNCLLPCQEYWRWLSSSLTDVEWGWRTVCTRSPIGISDHSLIILTAVCVKCSGNCLIQMTNAGSEYKYKKYSSLWGARTQFIIFWITLIPNLEFRSYWNTMLTYNLKQNYWDLLDLPLKNKSTYLLGKTHWIVRKPWKRKQNRNRK